MILDQLETNRRLESPDNLLNRMRDLSGPAKVVSIPEIVQAGIQKSSSIPGMPPTADELVSDLENKLKLGTISTNAVEVMNQTVLALRDNICQVDKVKDLSRIATDMSKLVTGIAELRGEKKQGPNQIIIYKPVVNQESHYETVVVHE